MLIALAEDHRFCQVQPDVDGFYMVWVCRPFTKFWIVLIPYTSQTRIVYHDFTLENFIFVTPKVAVETLEALENDEEVVRKANTKRLGDTRQEKDNVVLKIIAAILNEGLGAGATASFSDEGSIINTLHYFAVICLCCLAAPQPNTANTC